MNAYDFDKTIYDGDSSIDFYVFCMKRNFKCALRLPFHIFAFILYKIKMLDKKRFKEIFFSILKDFNDIDKIVDEFWHLNKSKICEWYLKQKKENDVIISASPYFLLKKMMDALEINNLIATDMDKKSGTIIGQNCYGIEKVSKFNEKFPNRKINNFYSDSYSDLPMINYAKNGYIVNLKKNTFEKCI